MIPLSTAALSGLTWSRLPHSQGCELKLHDEIVGTLRHPGKFSSCYVAEIRDSQWTFQRGGLLGAGAQILDAAAQQSIANFKSLWGGGGDLTFADGQVFHFRCKGWWHPVWSVTTAAGELVLSMYTRERTVEVPAVPLVPEPRLSLLTMFTLYRQQQAEEDAASAAMVSAILISASGLL